MWPADANSHDLMAFRGHSIEARVTDFGDEAVGSIEPKQPRDATGQALPFGRIRRLVRVTAALGPVEAAVSARAHTDPIAVALDRVAESCPRARRAAHSAHPRGDAARAGRCSWKRRTAP